MNLKLGGNIHRIFACIQSKSERSAYAAYRTDTYERKECGASNSLRKMKTAPNTDIASTFLSRNIRLIRYAIFGYRSKSQRDYGAESKWNIHFAQYSILSQFCRTESVYRIKQQHLSLTLQQCARTKASTDR